MDLPIPKREGELGGKVGQIRFTWCKSGGNKISDSCQGLKIAVLNELSKNDYKGPNLIPLRVTGRFWVRFFKYFIQFKVSLG